MAPRHIPVIGLCLNQAHGTHAAFEAFDEVLDGCYDVRDDQTSTMFT